MELTGRITADAKISTLSDGRKVVRFSIAINDSYKPRNATEWKKTTTYVNCSCWQREGLAPYLVKGTLVEISGRISVSAWLNAKGEPRGSLDFLVTGIKLHGGKSTANAGGKTAILTEKTVINEPADDLPF